jgi:holin-like protein
MVRLKSLVEILATIGVLTLFQLLGETLGRAAGTVIPGAVLGLLLLLATLLLLGPPPDWFARRCSQLIGLLSLFFLPAGTGIFFLGDLMTNQWMPIFGAIVVATPISILVTAGIMSTLLKRQ